MDILTGGSWMTVSLDNAMHNLNEVRRLTGPGCRVMAIVKADAYGQGALMISEEYERAGVEFLGVSSLSEALALRADGRTVPILILSYTPEKEAATLAQNNLTQTVVSPENAIALNAEAALAGVAVDIHIKIDTGMRRVGFNADAPGVEHEIANVFSLKHLRVCGVFTHFASADEPDADGVEFTRLQLRRFIEVCNRVKAFGYTLPLLHSCNSAGTVAFPEAHLDMVRPGMMLVGYNPVPDNQNADLRPVCTIQARVSMVKEIKAGMPVSYNRTYISERDMTIATIPLGYADGYPRALSSKGRMIVRGQFANVIGRVCMDQLMLDVTHISGVTKGDIVTVIGQDGDVKIDFMDMGATSGISYYELITRTGRRMPVLYTRGNQTVAILDYLSGGLKRL